MHLCDVVFPQNLPPLTYSVPAGLVQSVKPGTMVVAPLRGKAKRGMILRYYRSSGASFKGRLNEILDIVTPVYSPETAGLIEWCADYYIANHGTILKGTPFRDLVKPAKRPRQRPPAPPSRDTALPATPGMLDQVLASVRRVEYRTFLYLAASEEHEAGFVLGLVQGLRRAIILAPEVGDAESLYTLLRGLPGGERVCIYHGEMKKTERYDSVEGLCSGRYGIVVGTRPAVFAPLISPSVIVVTKEHNVAYKQEESPRYHGRDVAVMRGFTEGIPVVLSSVSPSVESCYNAFNNKYVLMRQEEPSRPAVSVIELRKGETAAPFLSTRLLRSLKSAVKKPEGPVAAMVVIQRRGYSMLKCDDCEELETCPECRTPLVVHKGEGLLCHLCGSRMETPVTCSRCGGFNLSPFGAGTERIEEELKRHLGIDIVRLDSDVSGASRTGKVSGSPDRYMVVGTLRTRRIPRKSLDIVAFLNPDLLLNLPEVRAPERLVQDVYSLGGLLSDKGRLLLQTEIPWHPVYRYLRRWDYMGFVKGELRVRRENSLPPYTRLVSLFIYTGDRSVTAETLGGMLKDALGDVDVIGPARTTPRIKGYSCCFRLMLRHVNRQVLKRCAKTAGKLIREAGMVLRIDVDPVLF